MLSKFRDGFFTAFRDERLAPDVIPESQAYRKPKLYVAEARVSPTVAAEIRSILEDLIQRLIDKGMDDQDGAVPVSVLVGYFTEADDQAGAS
jgi:hypothetical protein